MFIERLKKLCEENNTTITNVTEALGMSKGAIGNWKKGTIPNGEIIVRFAEHFNVSTDYLLTEKGAIKKELSEKEEELIECYRKLDNRGQCKVTSTAFDELERMETAERIAEHKNSEASAG